MYTGCEHLGQLLGAELLPVKGCFSTLIEIMKELEYWGEGAPERQQFCSRG